ERWVGTARRECLDHLLILGRRHLEYVLQEFVEHYQGGTAAPAPRPADAERPTHGDAAGGGPNSAPPDRNRGFLTAQGSDLRSFHIPQLARTRSQGTRQELGPNSSRTLSRIVGAVHAETAIRGTPRKSSL